MIGILDCGSGNLRSVFNAVIYEKGVAQISKSVDPEWHGLILPGVGAFGHVMRAVSQIKSELLDFLNGGKPFLGICLGLQVLFHSSEESPEEPGLGLMKGKIKRMMGGKIPHIGWNSIQIVKDSRLLQGVENGSYFYFVHSYAAKPEEDVTVATCEYEGQRFPSVVERDNIKACQFHPEKSGRVGLRVVRNFVRMAGGCR